MRRNQLIVFSLGLLLLLSFFAPTVHADGGKMYVVGQAIVELRDAPHAKAKVVVELPRGSKITVFQEVSGWGRTFWKGEEAWVPIYKLVPLSKDTGQKPEEAAKPSKGQIKKHAEQALLHPDDETLAENNSSIGEWQQIDEPSRRLLSSLEITNNQEQPVAESLAGYHFVIDPGHGGKDSGAIGADVYEKTLTLMTVEKLAKKLREAGANVTLTRDDDTFITLEKRVEISKNHQPDAFISIHYNAFENQNVRGINTFYYQGEQNRSFAQSVHTSIIEAVQLTDRGVHAANYYVLRKNQDLAILVELGFITNEAERSVIQTASYQEKVANAITIGLADFFNTQ